MRYILLTFCLLCMITGVSAQALKFDSSFCDFGEIKEDGGLVSHTFKFRNTSKTPIVITGSSTSCGCTVPTFSRKPILSGEESTVIVKFDPLYRPGMNSKSVLLYTSEGGSPIELEIRARVLPRTLATDERYPYKMSEELRVSGLYVTLGNVSHGESRMGVIEVINTSKRGLNIELRPRKANGALVIEYPKVLAAGEQGVFNIGYDIAAGSSYYGSMNDIIDIYIDSKKASLWMQSKAYIVDNFTSNIKNHSPSALFTKKFINFDAFNPQSGLFARRFEVSNEGVETLIIRKVESPEFLVVRPVGASAVKGVKEGASAVKGAKVSASTTKGHEMAASNIQGYEIKGGQSAEFEVLLDSQEFGLGANVYYITLILNSPEYPVERIKVVGRCEEGIK